MNVSYFSLSCEQLIKLRWEGVEWPNEASEQEVAYHLVRTNASSISRPVMLYFFHDNYANEEHTTEETPHWLVHLLLLRRQHGGVYRTPQ